MELHKLHTYFGRLLAAWIAVAGLSAAEHHGTVKSGGLPVPGASVTAIKGDKKLYTTTDENGRYSFADLADGAWTIEVEMLGFAKVSNEIGIAFDAPLFKRCRWPSLMAKCALAARRTRSMV